MVYVLVVITIFSTNSGVSSDTRFHEFKSLAACAEAQKGIETGVNQMKGTLGREIFTDCFKKG